MAETITTTNKCIESGCESMCCKNTILYEVLHVVERFGAYPNATKMPEDTDMDGLLNDSLFADGVYYKRTGENDGFEPWIVIAIKGSCPHLNGETGNCNIYGKCKRPKACEKLKIGFTECEEFRKRQDGLISLDSIK